MCGHRSDNKESPVGGLSLSPKVEEGDINHPLLGNSHKRLLFMKLEREILGNKGFRWGLEE